MYKDLECVIGALILIGMNIRNDIRKNYGCYSVYKDQFHIQIMTVKKESVYSTLNLIDNLVNELGPLPKASILLGHGSTYLSDLKQRITNSKVRGYNPNYKFSEQNLEKFQNNLKKSLGNKAINCLLFIKRYQELNKNLKEYSNQQYSDDLRADFFRKVDTLEKAYWLGFLYADGSVVMDYRGKPWYLISMELSIKDKDQIIRFCKALNLNPILIKERDRTKKNKEEWRTYQLVYLRFRCKPMVEDLMNIGFSSSKSLRKSIPIIFNKKTPINRKLFLAWVLGYYDGDGNANSTRITSGSKEFLEQIRLKLNIQYEVKIQYEKGKISNFDNIIATKSHWRLSLGASLFNEMMRTYKNSMPRKRRTFNERDMNVIPCLKEAVVNKENLQGLIDKYPISHLIKKFKVSIGSFYKLCEEWDIKTPRSQH